MAGSAQYTAVLDANVLYPALLRDVLLSLADADLYSAKWSVHIREEWTRSLLRDRPGMEAQIAAAAQAMEEAIPDCGGSCDSAPGHQIHALRDQGLRRPPQEAVFVFHLGGIALKRCVAPCNPSKMRVATRSGKSWGRWSRTCRMTFGVASRTFSMTGSASLP